MINFKESSLLNGQYNDIFKNVPVNIVICINKDNINKINSQIDDISCHIEDCTDNWKLKQKKLIVGNNRCINNCSDNNLYENNGKCYSNCPNGYFNDDNIVTKCKCRLEKCFTCPTVAFNKQLCTKCNDNYYQMENDPLNNYHCTENSECPKEFPHLIEDKKECVLQDIKAIENFIADIFNYETNETNEELSKEEEINKYNQILDNIETIFTSDNYDLTNIDKGDDQVISANKMVITFTNTDNQKNTLESNMSTIDLGDCEELLRIKYNLTNKTIYLKKIDITQDGMKAKKVEYNVYSKLSGNNLEN